MGDLLVTGLRVPGNRYLPAFGKMGPDTNKSDSQGRSHERCGGGDIKEAEGIGVSAASRVGLLAWSDIELSFGRRGWQRLELASGRTSLLVYRILRVLYAIHILFSY